MRIGAGDTGGSLIQVRNVTKTYVRGSEQVHVLQGLNLDIDTGDYVAFMGPSGSGKTTLLNLLGGLDLPTEGSVTVSGDSLSAMSRGRLTEWRARHVGFIFQMYNLIPVLTAFRNVELPLLLTPLNKAERKAHVETALRIVGLSDRVQHYPRQLSGGQQQRVAIARAIVADPAFLLCDEPTGDLDRKSASEILDLMDVLVHEHKKTILMVSHDPKAAERADLILGNVKFLLVTIGAVVFFTLLLVTGNTVAAGVRERTGELAVLKAVGFQDNFVLGLVFLESVLVAMIGGGLGLFGGYLFTLRGDPTGFFPAFYIPLPGFAAGIALMMATGLSAAIIPALGARRLSVIEALRRL